MSDDMPSAEQSDLTVAEHGHAHHLRVSRRAVLGGAFGAAVLSGAGAIGYAWPKGSASPAAAGSSPISSKAQATTKSGFKSRPDLIPPHLQVSVRRDDPDSGYVLLTPSAVPGARGVDESAALAEGLGQEGAMIVDRHGRLVWFQPTKGLATNLQVQTYKGEPVLTYWTGQINNGVGYGEGLILDSSYRTIATVKAGNGLKADLHELVLTPEGTALVTAYRNTTADLRSVGGQKNGSLLDSVVQEIDIASGKVLFEWRASDHVPVNASYAKPTAGAFDYFHINSIALDGSSGRLLVSSRNTWALYSIDRPTGEVAWRLNGKSSDYTMGSGTKFAWQHHARRLPDGNISVFDDGAAPAVESQSRGLVIALDDAKKTATLVHAYTHPAHLLAQFEGSAQLMPDGAMFLGWGGEPYFSEIAKDGTLLLDGRFPTNGQSYRAFRSPWVGHPAEPPVIVAEKDSVGGIAAYVSWNGATEVSDWRFSSGSSPSDLTETAVIPHGGFETAVTLHPTGSYLVASALDDSGKELARSKAIKV